MRPQATRFWFALLLAAPLSFCAAPLVHPAGAATLIPQRFYPYRPATPHGKRDLEFMWDSTYVAARGDTTPLPHEIQATLDHLSKVLCEDQSNPFNAPMSDLELVFDYFYPFGRIYDPNPNAPVGLTETSWMNLLKSGDPLPRAADTTHVDVYLYPPGEDGLSGGTTNSVFISTLEDTSSGRPALLDSVYHYNSVMAMGDVVPLGANRAVDSTGTQWTMGGRGTSVQILHEFAHTLYPDYRPLAKYPVLAPASNSPGVNEVFSSGAEQLVGQADPPQGPPFEVPYAWPLLSLFRGPRGNGCTNLLTVGVNYQNFRSFAAYLLYNFRGADTSATVAGFRDDLFYRWIHVPPIQVFDPSVPGTVTNFRHTLGYLESILTDDSCLTCAAKSYFHGPGNSPLPIDERFALLMHNWRTASYVNQPDLTPEGQYGFPPQFGFSPASNLSAWHSSDGCDTDNLISVPPETTVTRTGQTRTIVASQWRDLPSAPGAIYPMRVFLTGAEYWIVRSDASLSSGGPYTLRVRVGPDSLWRARVVTSCGQPDSALVYDTELKFVASVVGYSTATPSDSLWRHPEWATFVSPPQYVDVDSLEQPLIFDLPNFGSSLKAALVVITASAGRHNATTDDVHGVSALDPWYETNADPSVANQKLIDAVPAWPNVPYRVAFTIVDGAGLPSEPAVLASEAAVSEESPTWRPASLELAYVRTASGGLPQIYRKALSGSAAAVFASSDEERDPDWSPRGDAIVFTRGTSAGTPLTELWSATLSGTASPLTTNGGWKRWPAFCPNGQTIAYANRFNYGGQDRWGVWTVPIGGGAPSQIVQSSFVQPITALRWSPDANSIWFRTNDSLYVVTLSSGQVTNRPAVLPSGVASFDLHPANGRIAIEQSGNFKWLSPPCWPAGTAESFRRVALYDTTRADADPLLYRRGHQFFGPRWSPDGTKIAYSTGTPGGDLRLELATGNTDHAPVFTPGSYADASILTCSNFLRTLTASDADGETPTYEAIYLPTGAALVGGQLSWKPTVSQTGTYYVTVRAKDATGGVDQRVVQLTVSADTSGQSCDTNSVDSGLPTRFALGQNTPNPFSHSTTIWFDLPQSEHVKLEVFDLMGRRVRTLIDGDLPADRHFAQWDLAGDRGEIAHAGVYLYRISAGPFRDHRRMVVVP